MRMRGRRKAPGRPITYGTTTEFLIQFGLDAIADLPGLDELRGRRPVRRQAAGGLRLSQPSDEPALRSDEEPLDGPGPLDQVWGPVAPDEGN